MIYKYKYDISIVMGYYNRKNQIINTLNDFETKYKTYNYEVIIIDDNSDKNHCLDDIIQNYSFSIKYIKISENEKGNRINPCVTYNKGFKISEGERIILQNPECIHIGNICKFVIENLSYDDYIAFSCFSCSSQKTTNLLLNDINLINNTIFKLDKMNCWYNHPIIRPVHYHFCASIMNDNLKLLGGFNEEFAEGHSYDDNEILLSIQYNLLLNIKTIPPLQTFVVHQWHTRDAESTIKQKDFSIMLNRNKTLYEKYLHHHQQCCFSFPKLLHLYWDGSNFSFLNLMTVLSFNKYHFGWKINIFCPLIKNENISWVTNEQKTKYNGKNYFDELKEIKNVNIHYIDTNLFNFKYKEASEVIKSDYFRLYILNKFGGVWSDFDIIYTNSIEKYCKNREINKDKKVVIFKYITTKEEVFPVGFFISHKNNNIFKPILDNIEIFYNKNYYQCLGCFLFYNIFKNSKKNPKMKDILLKMNLKELYIDNADCYLKIKWNELEKLYVEKNNIEFFTENNKIIGIHWFNGSDIAKNYCNNLDMNKLKRTQPNCLIDKFVKEYI